RHRPGHADESGLGGGVVHLPGVAVSCHHRGHEHDASAPQPDHAFGCAPGAAKGSGEVDVEDVVEFLIAHAHQELVTVESGVSYEDLDGAVLRLDLTEGRIDRVTVAH